MRKIITISTKNKYKRNIATTKQNKTKKLHDLVQAEPLDKAIFLSDMSNDSPSTNANEIFRLPR